MSESTGIIAAVAFFFLFAGVAYIAFRLLRKTVNMAFRMAIVAVILVIAVAGSVSFWWLGTSDKAAPRSRPIKNK